MLFVFESRPFAGFSDIFETATPFATFGCDVGLTKALSLRASAGKGSDRSVYSGELNGSSSRRLDVLFIAYDNQRLYFEKDVTAAAANRNRSGDRSHGVSSKAPHKEAARDRRSESRDRQPSKDRQKPHSKERTNTTAQERGKANMSKGNERTGRGTGSNPAQRTSSDGNSRRQADRTQKEQNTKTHQSRNASRDRDKDKWKQPTTAKEGAGAKESSRKDKEKKETNKTVIPKGEQKEEEPDEGYEYEDDFEDYEEDFEEDFEDDFESPSSSDQAPQQRKSAEKAEVHRDYDNDSSLEQPGSQPDDTSEPKTAQDKHSANTNSSRTGSSKFDFSKAALTEKQLASETKIRKREKDLLKLIELDIMRIDAFQMAPVRDYEFYIQAFGKSNRVQVLVQTGDDSIDREVQTEDIENDEVWCQHPPARLKASGSTSGKKTFEENSDDLSGTEPINHAAFKRFVVASGNLVAGLFELFHSDEHSNQFAQASEISFCEKFTSLSLHSFGAGRWNTVAMEFCRSQPSIFITCAICADGDDNLLGRKGGIFLWNIHSLPHPQKILLSDGEPAACCFGPSRGTFVFAGCKDGSLAAWDLTELESLHSTFQLDNKRVPLISACYDTAYLSGEAETHSAPVVAVEIIGGDNLQETSSASDQSHGVYQLISLGSDGTVIIWSVLLSQSTETSELDLGLRPGSRLKLVKAAIAQPFGTASCMKPLSSSRQRNTRRLPSIHAYCLAQSSTSSSQFYIGTDSGYILHMSRHQATSVTPRIYRANLEAPSSVLSMDFSPFEPTVLLAGLSEGLVMIYKVDSGYPMLRLHLPDDSYGRLPVVKVAWSHDSPYIFYSLHGAETLITWDLKNSISLPSKVDKTAGYSSLALSGRPRLEAGKVQFYAAFASNSGDVELHLLKGKGSKYKPSDGYKLLRTLETA